MDGVLVDFRKGAANLGINIDPQDKQNSNDEELWQAVNAHGKAKFFEELPWTPDGKQLWKFTTENFLNIKILTALGKSDKTDQLTSKGKRAWLRINIPPLRDRDIHMVPNKHAKKHYARPGDILIDDTPLCISEWLKKGGIGILHTNTQDTTRQLEKYI